MHVLGKVRLEELPVDIGIDFLSSGDWSDGHDNNIGDILTSRVVLGVVVVSGGLGNLGGDIFPVGQEVLGDGLNEGCWVSEDLGPGLNLGDVVLDVFALSEVLWKFSDDDTEFLNSLDHV